MERGTGKKGGADLNPQDPNALRQFDLAALEAVDIRTVDPAALVDIREVAIDTKLPKQARLASFLQQIKNPYCYKCGRMIVKVGFGEGTTLEEQLKTIFSTMI